MNSPKTKAKNKLAKSSKMPSSSCPEKKQKSLSKPMKPSPSSIEKKKKKIQTNSSNHHKYLPSWATKWLMRPKEREDGRIDRFYIHKENGMTCRSLKEVERYEFHGILPPRSSKTNGRGKTKENMCDNEEASTSDCSTDSSPIGSVEED
ncbi:uncharacterized protein LOC109789463 [Cajanus cajan]|uniref:uncharacterized protein LOC109789463 n=1 Tax=Cajanus cajan TaxID=3821 RepID=UPI00098DB6EF|nr:uncharacterized protein LOC109789463 [Cajanus cajan]